MPPGLRSRLTPACSLGCCRAAPACRLAAGRVLQMVELAHAYLIEFLTQGRAALADDIFDPEARPLLNPCSCVLAC